MRKDVVKEFKSAVKGIWSKRHRKDYAKALKQLDRLMEKESFKWSPYLLILRSELIQMSEGNGEENWTLESAEDNLRTAVVLDPRAIDASIELGWFLENVLDKPRKAVPCFEQAMSLCWEYLHSAMIGRAQCINDLEGPQAALSAIKEVESLFPGSGRAAELKSDYIRAIRYHRRKKS